MSRCTRIARYLKHNRQKLSSDGIWYLECQDRRRGTCWLPLQSWGYRHLLERGYISGSERTAHNSSSGAGKALQRHSCPFNVIPSDGSHPLELARYMLSEAHAVYGIRLDSDHTCLRCRYNSTPPARHPHEATIRALASGMDVCALKAILSCEPPTGIVPGSLSSLSYSWVNTRAQLQTVAVALAEASVCSRYTGCMPGCHTTSHNQHISTSPAPPPASPLTTPPRHGRRL